MSNSKLSESNVRNIRKRIADGIKTRDIADRYGVSIWTIHDIRQNKTWQHVTDQPPSK